MRRRCLHGPAVHVSSFGQGLGTTSGHPARILSRPRAERCEVTDAELRRCSAGCRQRWRRTVQTATCTTSWWLCLRTASASRSSLTTPTGSRYSSTAISCRRCFWDVLTGAAWSSSPRGIPVRRCSPTPPPWWRVRGARSSGGASTFLKYLTRVRAPWVSSWHPHRRSRAARAPSRRLPAARRAGPSACSGPEHNSVVFIDLRGRAWSTWSRSRR